MRMTSHKHDTARRQARARHVRPRMGSPVWCVLLVVLLAWTPALCKRSKDAAAAADPSTVEWILDDGVGDKVLPLDEPSVVLPPDLQRALDLYRAGDFRRASAILENYRSLALPDGNFDFVVFALAECYRQLGLRDFAEDNYQYILDRFTLSDKRAPSRYRLLEYACRDGNMALADSIYAQFDSRLRVHPLFNSVLYAMARLYYKRERFAEAVEVAGRVPSGSSRHAPAQFLCALCQLRLKAPDKALILLDYVRKNARDPNLVFEAGIVIGDIYYSRGDIEAAYRYYVSVPEKALRYYYALVRATRCEVDLKQYEKARDRARAFCEKNPDHEYFLEMMSLLEQAYTKLDEKRNAERAGLAVMGRVQNSRVIFEAYEELNRTTDALSQWRSIRNTAGQQRDAKTLAEADKNIASLEELGRKAWNVLREISPDKRVDRAKVGTDLAVLRYMGQVRNRMHEIEDSVVALQRTIDSTGVEYRIDSSFAQTPPSELVVQREDLKKALSVQEREYAAVSDEFIGGGRLALDDRSPAKYVDWAFTKYLEKKTRLRDMSKQLSSRKDTARVKQSLLKSKGTQVVKLFAAVDRDRLAAELAGDRAKLIGTIESMQGFFPRNRYNSQILFRLAELYYDVSGDDFDKRLSAYEKAMGSGKDTTGREFPEYDLSKVIDVYDRIINRYAGSAVAPDAYFYKALALQKLNQVDQANDVLLELCKKYPESEYYVEANMLVGRYYFEHPKILGSKGYKLAEEAFREVLYYRDHPQFVQALYNLGWCYYMQDQYEEAIAVFKYLIEEVELDFDPTRMSEKQVTNPLLRGEAIDYIAISFDEEDRLDDAIKFLQLVGNVDYAALVIKRIAELREEVQDWDPAKIAYTRLLAEYPGSAYAPDAAASLIKIYDLQNMTILSLEERERFFLQYHRGSDWWKQMARKDSSAAMHADSMAISNGLYVADVIFRRAETTGSTDDYVRAARDYRLIVDTYNDNPNAADSRWNLAVILDQKLGKGDEAYDEYVGYSQLASAPIAQREQAALNAISLAQRYLPVDTAIQEGKLEPAAVKMIDAVENYTGTFTKGKDFASVVLSLGALYFNRKMYSNAADAYDKILVRGPQTEDYYHALFMQGQCRFGEDNWTAASKAFEVVSQKSADFGRRNEARKLFLQSEYLQAKKYFAAGDFDKASRALVSIEDRFPQSQYGDIVLFNAAEAYEKINKLEDASGCYKRLVDNYPSSKLAPDALFNAASNYEKITKFDLAAEVYEMLSARFPKSEKAKDALFNLGLCYEKLGKLEKMAEANDRYTALYPGEKDAKLMMMRSATFYFKAGMFDKARAVFMNFARRFTNEPEAVESYFMIAKCYMEEKDRINALSYFKQTEQQHDRQVKAGAKGNSFYAAEAACFTAQYLRDDFMAIDFSSGAGKLKDAQTRKAEALSEAVKAYTRVVQYQSVRMFEAGFRIGDMYEAYATAWTNQKRDKLDPVKAAVQEKDILQASSILLQKSLGPYKKVLELARGFDSLGAEQRAWVDTTQIQLSDAYAEAGSYLVKSVGAMLEAPIPKEIQKSPLHYFAYLKQLNEAVGPLKGAARDYYKGAFKDLSLLGIDKARAKQCLEKSVELDYRTGHDFERIAEMILKKQYQLPDGIGPDDREDLEFQLEDVVFELQDKAIFAYEDAVGRITGEESKQTSWYKLIMESLAKLSPETYGKNVFKTSYAATGSDWACRADSVEGWKEVTAPVADGWVAAKVVDVANGATLPGGKAQWVWSPDKSPSAYLRKDLFLDGLPREAAMYLAVGGAYRLFVNGVLTAGDTIGQRTTGRVDSLPNIGSLFAGGENCIAVEARASDPSAIGIGLSIRFMLDTTQHFEQAQRPSLIPGGATAPEQQTPPQKETTKPDKHEAASQSPVAPLATAPAPSSESTAAVPESTSSVPAPADTAAKRGIGSQAPSESGQVRSATASSKRPAAAPTATGPQYRSRKEVQAVLLDYQTRAVNTDLQVKRERIEIQKQAIKKEYLDARIKSAADETAALKKELEAMAGQK